MTREVLTAAIIAPSAEERELLSYQVSTTGLASVKVELEHYCADPGDFSTRELLDVAPDAVLIDMEVPEAAIRTLHVLQTALPGAWLFVCSQKENTNLIIEAMRAGAREFLIKPLSVDTIAEAFNRLITLKQQASSPTQAARGKIYSITSAKGGAGATSVAINLAACLADIPSTTAALIDLTAPVGDVAAYLNLHSEFTVSDALSSASRLDSVLLKNYMSQYNGVDVLAGLREFQVGDTPDARALHRMLQVAAETYTHTLVDMASSLKMDQLQVLFEVSSVVLLVVNPDLPSVWRADRLLRFLVRVGDIGKVRLVVNRREKGEEIKEREIETILKCPVFAGLPNDYAASIQAINSGKPLISTNHSQLARSYRELAHRLTGAPVPERTRRFFGLFSQTRHGG